MDSIKLFDFSGMPIVILWEELMDIVNGHSPDLFNCKGANTMSSWANVCTGLQVLADDGNIAVLKNFWQVLRKRYFYKKRLNKLTEEEIFYMSKFEPEDSEEAAPPKKRRLEQEVPGESSGVCVRLDNHDAKLQNLAIRMSAIESEVSSLKTEMSSLKTVVEGIARQLADLSKAVKRKLLLMKMI